VGDERILYLARAHYKRCFRPQRRPNVRFDRWTYPAIHVWPTKPESREPSCCTLSSLRKGRSRKLKLHPVMCFCERHQRRTQRACTLHCRATGILLSLRSDTTTNWKGNRYRLCRRRSNVREASSTCQVAWKSPQLPCISMLSPLIQTRASFSWASRGAVSSMGRIRED
jgi:hypothetical protein